MIDKIYCINLDRRSDRWASCIEQFTKHNIIVERVSAIDWQDLKLDNRSAQNKARIACTMSHLKCLEKAKSEDARNVLIFEDDVLFVIDNFTKAFSKHVEHVPTNWDMLYLGSNKIKHRSIGNGILKLIHAHTTHAYMVNGSFISTLIDVLKCKLDQWVNNPTQDKNVHAIDVVYSNMIMPKYNVYAFEHTIASQRMSYSDIEHINVNYSRQILR